MLTLRFRTTRHSAREASRGKRPQAHGMAHDNARFTFCGLDTEGKQNRIQTYTGNSVTCVKCLSGMRKYGYK